MQPLLLAVLIAVGDAPQAPAREQIAPVAVTARRLPDLGDPFEIRNRQLQERELARRPYERDDLERNRALWSEKRVNSYRFTVSIRGGWGIDTGGVVVTVRNGVIASTEHARPPLPNAHGNLLDAKTIQSETLVAAPYDTVPGLFGMVERALNDSFTLISVRYDSQYGYPIQISTDRLGASDSAYTTYVRGFEILE